jgi:hypothetical protein
MFEHLPSCVGTTRSSTSSGGGWNAGSSLRSSGAVGRLPSPDEGGRPMSAHEQAALLEVRRDCSPRKPPKHYRSSRAQLIDWVNHGQEWNDATAPIRLPLCIGFGGLPNTTHTSLDPRPSSHAPGQRDRRLDGVVLGCPRRRRHSGCDQGRLGLGRGRCARVRHLLHRRRVLQLLAELHGRLQKRGDGARRGGLEGGRRELV